MIESLLQNVGNFFVSLWAWLASEAGSLAALAAVVTAVVAVVALSSTARDSRERSRPVVLALFRLAEHSDTAFDLVVRNYGKSAARKIDVAFDPPFDSTARAEPTTKALAERFDPQIPLLPPDAEICNVYWSGRNDGSPTLVNKLLTADKVTITITYKGNRFRRYKDVIPLDANWMGLSTRSQSSTSVPGRMKQIAESLHSISDETKANRRELESIANSLARDEPETDASIAG